MAEKKQSDGKGAAPAAPEPLTFTEENVKHFCAFIDLVAQLGRFTVDTKTAIKYATLYGKMVELAKVMEENVFEVKRIVKPKETT